MPPYLSPPLPSPPLPSQFLDGMSEKIRQGIQAAETDLSKEKEKLQQEEVWPLNINRFFGKVWLSFLKL